eukprot:Nk52_evm22s2273 gene=Nk52_evmTU22s2273
MFVGGLNASSGKVAAEATRISASSSSSSSTSNAFPPRPVDTSDTKESSTSESIDGSDTGNSSVILGTVSQLTLKFDKRITGITDCEYFYEAGVNSPSNAARKLFKPFNFMETLKPKKESQASLYLKKCKASKALIRYEDANTSGNANDSKGDDKIEIPQTFDASLQHYYRKQLVFEKPIFMKMGYDELNEVKVGEENTKTASEGLLNMLSDETKTFVKNTLSKRKDDRRRFFGKGMQGKKSLLARTAKEQQHQNINEQTAADEQQTKGDLMSLAKGGVKKKRGENTGDPLFPEIPGAGKPPTGPKSVTSDSEHSDHHSFAEKVAVTNATQNKNMGKYGIGKYMREGRKQKKEADPILTELIDELGPKKKSYPMQPVRSVAVGDDVEALALSSQRPTTRQLVSEEARVSLNTFTQRIINDISNIHYHVKLDGILRSRKLVNNGQVREVILALIKCLDHEVLNIRFAAATSLVCMGITTQEQVIRVLREAIEQPSTDVRWSAACYLGYAKVTDPKVFEVLIGALEGKNEKKQMAAQILRYLSVVSAKVIIYLNQALQSCNWRLRYSACNIIGSINRQNVNTETIERLLRILWIDWRLDVRKAAATALERLGESKTAFETLIDKLGSKSELGRIDAIKALVGLGQVPDKIITPFVALFRDPYTTVKLEALNATQELNIARPKVFQELLHLTTDPIAAVRREALKVLASMPQLDTSEVLPQLLLWPLCFDNDLSVVKQALYSITKIKAKTPDLTQALIDMYLHHESSEIRAMVDQTLDILQVNTFQLKRESLEEGIKHAVKGLGSGKRVTEHILAMGSSDDNMLRYCSLSESETDTDTGSSDEEYEDDGKDF